MDWTWYELLASNALGVHWSVGALALAVLITAAAGLLWHLAWGRRNPAPELRHDPPPTPDPRTERISASGLPSPRPMEVMQAPSADLGAILGPGTPLMGPAPPSIGYEQDKNVMRVDDLGEE